LEREAASSQQVFALVTAGVICRRRFFQRCAGLQRLFATLWPTCPFNTSFKQLLPAGEPGFGAPVIHGTPEAPAPLIALSLHCPPGGFIPN